MKVAPPQRRDDIAKAGTAGETICPLPDCNAALRVIAKGCIEAIRASEAQASSGEPDAIHAMRIELTRLRAARLFFARAVDDPARRRIDGQLRWLNSVLGRARDRDVAIEYVGKKRYREWARHSRRALLRSQGKAHRRLAKELGSARYNCLTSALGAWISTRLSTDGSTAPRSARIDTYCDDRLREWRDEISALASHVRELRRKPQHQLRILSKNYRYMVDTLLELDVPVSREDFLFCETAKRIHRALGNLRDLGLLRRAVGRRPPHYRKRKRKLIRQVEGSFARFAPARSR